METEFRLINGATVRVYPRTEPVDDEAINERNPTFDLEEFQAALAATTPNAKGVSG
jgi:hypothetical protein